MIKIILKNWVASVLDTSFFLVGNEEFMRDEETPCIIVKQEPVDETCNRPHIGVPFSSTWKRPRNRSDSVYEFSEKIWLENVEDRNHLDRESPPKHESYFDSPTRPEKIRKFPGSSRETESHSFPWPTEKELRCLRFEAGKSPLRASQNRDDYLSCPDKSSFSRFQSPPTANSYFSEGIPGRQRNTDGKFMEEVDNRERREILQYENAKRLLPDLTNAGENKRKATTITMNEDYGSNSPRERSSFSGRSDQNGHTQKADSTLELNEKVNITYFNRKDEEPVWKTYQWYRDRKRPYTQKSRKRHKAEQTIFMQYNEIRDKRCQEGRVVSVRRRISEPPKALLNSFTEVPIAPPSTSSDTAEYADFSNLNRTSSESSKAKSDPTLSHSEKALWKGSEKSDFERKGYKALHPDFNRGDVQRVDRDDNSNFEVHEETGRVVLCKKGESQNDVASPVNDDEVCTALSNKDLGEISSTTYENDTRILPETFRHCPQDVAKILRLNRIVNNVKHNRDGQLPASARKDVLLEGQEKRQSNDFDRQDVKRASEDEQNPMENVLSSPEANPHKGQIKRLEVRPDYSGFSDSDQETFVHGQTILDDEDTVCQVNGLLSLPGFKETKYNISLGELKRRMNPPETLTRVEMISYLRQAKSSGRFLLDRHNIVTANRSHPTILSRICEGEAQVLADGILKMNREYLPLATLARKTVEAYKDDGCRVVNCEDCRLKLRRRIVDVEITR